MANPPGTRIDIAVCQKHGLRYNRATDTGCAFCRRDGEVAEPAPAPMPAAPPPRPLPSSLATPPRSAAPRATGASSISDAAGEPRSTVVQAIDIATCDKHGLRYNRATDKGCVRCRAESSAATGGTRRGAAPGRAAAEAPASLPIQLLIAALLVGGSGGLFFAAHQSVLESFAGGVLANAGEAGAEAAAAPGDASYDAPDPASWPPPRPTATPPVPPGMRGRGPAEQQKQIEELFRQMKEDEEKERGEAPEPGSDLPQ